MEKIFENIKFGDKFLTRGGKVAIFLHKVGTNDYLDDDKRFYCFGTDLETFSVNEKGMYNDDSTTTDCLDIVSKYIEPIDEDNLCEFASVDTIEIANKGWHDEDGFTKSTLYRCCRDSFITGYKKAKEE